MRKHLEEVDSGIVKTILFRSWNIVAGGVTLLLIPIFLSKEIAGYYFTFNSVVLLQVFFELGLSSVIVVKSAALFSNQMKSGAIEADNFYVNKIRILVKALALYYLGIALLFLVVSVPVGYYIFSSRVSQVVWLTPLLALLFFTAINLFLSFLLSLEEGAGNVDKVAHLRLIQSIIGHAGFWVTIILGGQLYATLCIPIASIVFTLRFLLRTDSVLRKYNINYSALKQLRGGGFSWKNDIFSLQWKIALSWASGYFIFQLYTPFIFKYYGAEVAGQVGYSLSIFNAILTLSQGFVAASTPRYISYIANADFPSFNRAFNSHAILSVFANGFLVVLFISGFSLFIGELPSISGRLLDLSCLLAIGASTFSQSMILAMATYMRAFGDEPMLIPSVVGALITPVIIWVGNHAGLAGIFWLSAAWTTVVGVSWTYLLFIKHKRCPHLFS